MKSRQWSLAIVLILINYIIFATLFTRLLETDFSAPNTVRAPVPTFTPLPAAPLTIVPTPEPVTPPPTPTATRVMDEAAPEGSASSAGDQIQAENPPAPAEPAVEAQLVAPGAVNIRSGPGLNYTVIGTLNANTAMPIVGRNTDATWWQIRTPNDATGWVANSVVNVTNVDNVPLAESPASLQQNVSSIVAQPAAKTDPPPTPKPAYQFEPIGWDGASNAGMTRFSGEITDADGNPVDGVFVQASCGDFSTISFPSGPVGWGAAADSAGWTPGYYDILIDQKPVPCLWVLTIVETDDRETVKARLSEAVPVEITADKSVVTANWRKNW